MSTVIEIVKAHLVSIGADGLVCPPAECGCKLGDLAPCGENFSACQPGWVSQNPDGTGEWLMWSSKELAARAAAKNGGGI